ncbi:MAG: hypothetical protein LBQ54_06165 [Planctomycetaceae bacterium]|jgi:ribosomal protein S18 acetylase RimI-like enzyme|nr:hypothetical protein [Planctomycetaceae bacterium]
MTTLQFHETTWEELHAVLDLQLHHVSAEQREERILGLKSILLQEAENTGSDVCPGLYHWRRHGKIAGVLHTFLRPDKTILALPPSIAPDEPESILRILYSRLCDDAVKHHSPTVMIFVDRERELDKIYSAEAGFEKISELLYLVSQEEDFPRTPPMEQLRFTPYRRNDWLKMVDLVEQTYAGTQDFPTLIGICPTEEILKGYMESHPFQPELWFFIEREQEMAGTLLLTQWEQPELFELTYLGLTPQFRGQKLSSEIIRFAQYVTFLRHGRQLTVSVDMQNIPAVKSYHKTNFLLYDSKEIFVRFFR